MAGLGRRTFVAGEVLTAANVQNYLQDQAVMVFGGTAARASAIPTPSEGMVTYQTDTDQLTYYDGTNWDQLAPLDSPTFTGTVSAATISASGDISGAIVSGVTSPGAGRGLLVRQPSGDATEAILQFTNNAVTAQRASINSGNAGDLIFNPASGVIRNGAARVGASVGGSGTTTSGSNLTVTHGLGTTPTAVAATVRANTYSAALNTNIFVGNIGATTFTVFANNGAGGAVAAAFNWIAVS